MPKVINFYMDDSGTRHPDHAPMQNRHGNDWFALGGVLVCDEDEEGARDLHERFCKEWNITYPLHSADIRAKSKEFHWLNELDAATFNSFMLSIDQLATLLPLVGIACVIDRPGYNLRYREKYGRQRWSLCKTAFCIAVERAAKYAAAKGYRLRVCPERCNKKDDTKLAEYYAALKAEGQPFFAGTSEKYDPLSANAFSDTLYEFRLKNKSSPMAQMADLYLWPMCVGGYDANNRVYRLLMKGGKLLDALVDVAAREKLGTKYSCMTM